MSRTVVECPSCSQSLRVPTDRGAIIVTCGACSLEWRWKPDDHVQDAEHVEEVESSDNESGGSGIFSWFSKTTQKLTGSSADVYVDPTPQTVQPGESTTLNIDVRVSDFELDAQTVKAELVGEEIVALPRNKVRRKLGVDFDAVRNATNMLIQGEKFVHQECIFHREYRVTENVSWDPNSKVQLDAPIAIPDDAIPSFGGETIGARWAARAVVETSGTNPKSEWTMVEVSNE